MKTRTKVATKTKIDLSTKILAVIAVGAAAAIIGAFGTAVMPIDIVEHPGDITSYRLLDFKHIGTSDTKLHQGVMEVLQFSVAGSDVDCRIYEHIFYGEINAEFPNLYQGRFEAWLYEPSTERNFTKSIILDDKVRLLAEDLVFIDGKTRTFSVMVDLSEMIKSPGSNFEFTLAGYREIVDPSFVINPLVVRGLPIRGTQFR